MGYVVFRLGGVNEVRRSLPARAVRRRLRRATHAADVAAWGGSARNAVREGGGM
jgi:hypothetical protein